MLEVNGEIERMVELLGAARTEMVTQLAAAMAIIRDARLLGRIGEIAGLEAAGLIEALGSDVDGLAVGDRVAVISGETGRGDYCEVALAPARTLVKIPDDQSWQEAAATWMAFATAWTGLISIAGLSAGWTVLITAASSSTGLAAIQTARKVGAIPIALTRTSAKAAALREAGAAHIIATEEQDLVAKVAQLTGGKGAEMVFDAVGGATFERLVEATAIGGLLVAYGRLSPDATPAAAGAGLVGGSDGPRIRSPDHDCTRR